MPLPVLSPSDVQSVQASFAQIGPAAPRVPELFYRRLFELDPALRGLFHGDMRSQGQKLLQMLAFIARGLTQPEMLLPAVRELGVRHAGYRVRDEHYATVQQALLETLAEVLGPAFTAEVRAAWTRALELVSGVMIESAAAARARIAAG